MSQPIVTVEGRRVYIRTQYGDPCVQRLKELGAHWDPQTKRWWLSATKKDEVEAAVASTAGQPSDEDPHTVRILGKAKYKGRTYYVRWVGVTKSGTYKARLCSLDQKIDFWAAAARPHETHITGDGDVAYVFRIYQEARSLDSIRRYIDELRRSSHSGADRGEKPDEECYWGGEDWLVKGCAACKAAGRMCPACRHDIYDR